ncbi:GntP family permease [uncultured Fusobacterium sp.]|uniref:GntP family permease n=1 Tax=uncultured Fusobacterium sp. TaxID=159267 RepID=UPI0025CE2A98|nr:GntP family permease [uncultured Fusobacterium sp.]
MDILSVIGLILAVVVLVIGAYKGLGALPLTLLASLVVILSSKIPIWTGFSQYYMNGYTSAYFSYFLLFCSSALYAKLMDISGCATSIGYQFIDWFGKKRVLLVSTLIISVLTYGGVSLFVVVYAVAPIMFLLFKEANLPRHLTMACLITGSATYTMTSLPGTTALTNVIPTQYLGTTLTAAPVFGILAIVVFTMAILYMGYAERLARKRGEVWSYPENADPLLYEIKDRSQLPSVTISFTPLVSLVLIIIIGSRFVANSTMLAVLGMLVGALLTYVLNIARFKDKNMKNIFTTGLEGGITSIGGLAGVVGFGTVVSNSIAFKHIVSWVLGLQLNPYVQAIVATMVVCAVTGSSSGGLKIMYDSLGKTFLSSTANLPVLHRLSSISASALDTLPHSPGLFLMFAVLGLNHKTAYKHVFVCSIVIPSIVTIVSTVIIVIFL